MYVARNLVNIEDYPIHIDGGKRNAVLKTVRDNLAHDGCAVLKNFLTADGIAALTKEADAVAGNAHRSYNCTNVYFTADDETLPANDPRRRFYDRSNAFIPADNFQTDGALRTYMILKDLIALFRTVFRKMHFTDMLTPWRM